MKIYIGPYPSTKALRLNPDKVQKKYIRIDRHDTWNMAETLAEIILPMLIQLRQFKHGSPGTMPAFNESADHQWPQMSFDFYKEGDNDAWNKAHSQWDEYMDKMIWSFEQIVIEDRDSQFHSGHSNWTLQPSASGAGSQMIKGPGHTATFDRKAYEEYYKKIQEGLDLFGKYYMNLWD
jgi:hypothetical protein